HVWIVRGPRNGLHKPVGEYIRKVGGILLAREGVKMDGVIPGVAYDRSKIAALFLDWPEYRPNMGGTPMLRERPADGDRRAFFIDRCVGPAKITSVHRQRPS